MTIISRPQVVLSKLVGETEGHTHTGVKVTKTATMLNGALLVAAGTQAAKAASATVVYVIDDPRINQAAVGDVLTVSCAKFGCILNKAVLNFSDGGLAAEALTALEAKACSVQEIKTI